MEEILANLYLGAIALLLVFFVAGKIFVAIIDKQEKKKAIKK